MCISEIISVYKPEFFPNIKANLLNKYYTFKRNSDWSLFLSILVQIDGWRREEMMDRMRGREKYREGAVTLNLADSCQAMFG